MSFVCGVCAFTQAIEVFSYSQYPLYLVPLPLAMAGGVPRSPLALAACAACGHFQVPFVDPDAQRILYEVYYTHYEVDTMESMVPAYREPFNQVMQASVVTKGSLLEIGCSSGAMIPFLNRFCHDYTGVDPSERIEIARNRYPQHHFIRSYFPPSDPIGTFDVVVTQFNLEHILDVSAFVATLAATVRPGGVLVVQVPDARYFLRTGQPNFLAHEHVHYFRRPQLERLLRTHGFDPEIWGEEGPSLICSARRSESPLSSPVAVDPLADAKALSKLLTTLPALPTGAVLYGVGLTLHWLLAQSPAFAAGALVVDDNPGYAGKGVPGYDLQIVAPSPALMEGRSIILTLNAIYHERVLERLRGWGVTGLVHLITDGEWSTCRL